MSTTDDDQRRPRRWSRTLWALISAAVGAVLVSITIIAFHHDRNTPTGFGAAPLSARPTVPSPSSPVTHGRKPPPSTHHGSPALTPPAQLAIPTLGVQAAVQNVVTVNGVLGVPDNISDVGWWTGSVPPGSPEGSTVIDGHVDSAVTGTGALFRLTDLRPGDMITVTSTTGATVPYRVYARQIYVKHQGLPADLFTTHGPPRLVLITCGGPFDTSTRNYEDNIVVLASPSS